MNDTTKKLAIAANNVFDTKLELICEPHSTYLEFVKLLEAK